MMLTLILPPAMPSLHARGPLARRGSPVPVDLDALYAARSLASREAVDDEASGSTRDDGALYHGRLPSDDVDWFNPSIDARQGHRPARAPDVSPPARSMILPPRMAMGSRS